MQQFSVLSSRDISNNSLNTSVTKQQYSFQKTPRFSKYQPNCPLAYYDKPDIKTKRSASIGYGRKHDFTNLSYIVSPGPSVYEKKSEFETSRENARGKSFGVSRDKMFENGHIVPGIQKNPGVGNYILDRSLNKTSYSIRKKTCDIYNPVFLLGGKRTYLEVPGPGAYEQQEAIKKDGKQFFAKYSSSGAPIIDPTSKRFTELPYTPGPSHYNTYQQSGINDKATYTLSKHRGQGTRAFSQDKRIHFTDRTAQSRFAPGPGSYRQPSDFGIYDHLDTYRTQSSGFGKQHRKADTFIQTK